MNRIFLYIDILGFEKMVLHHSEKIDRIFSVIDELKVHKHFALHSVMFSDTLLIFNRENEHPEEYYVMYLIEYAQELFYRLSLFNVYFRGILLQGEFSYKKLAHIERYYGDALIRAYRDDHLIKATGLFIDKRVTRHVVTFDTVAFSDTHDFVLLCKSLSGLSKAVGGKLPIDLRLLSDTDDYYRVDEDLRFLREIQFLKEHHPDEAVRVKHQRTYDLYRAALPLFFAAFEREGFLPFALHPDYTGHSNPFELAQEELEEESTRSDENHQHTGD